MKIICLALLCGLFSTSSGWAQRVRGGFVLDMHGGGGVGGDEFFYFTAGRFLFYNITDTGRHYGSGTFRYKGDSLVLRFDEWQAPSVRVRVDPDFRTASSADSLTIRVLDAITGETLPGVAIASDTLPGRESYTSVDGLAQLPVARLPAGKARLTYVNYQMAQVQLPLREGRHFLVRIHPLAGRVAGNTRLAFFVKQTAGRPILLDDQGADYQQVTSKGKRYHLARYKEIDGRYWR